MKIGIIGLGKMGEALLKGIRAEDPKIAITATTRTDESARETAKRLGIRCETDNAKVVRESDVILLCVKPHQVHSLLEPLADQFNAKHTLISICASITTAQLAEWTHGHCAVIRAMPNTPALIGEGMTAIALGPKATSAHQAIAERLFKAVGQTANVEEHLMDGVTGLSGCGPAYVYMIIEALSEAGVKVGLPRKTSTQLAAQTLLGAAKMVMQRAEHPAALKDEVTTPAGCTIDGLMALEEGKLRVTLIKAVLAATRRSQKLREGQ